MQIINLMNSLKGKNKKTTFKIALQNILHKLLLMGNHFVVKLL